MKIWFAILLFSASLYAGEIRVAVAANVSYAINDLIKAFNTVYTDIKVKVRIASSGKLTAQIINGAPYDIFMSANMLYPEKLYKNGIAVTRPLIYAKGALAYFSVKKRDFSDIKKLLEDHSVERIAVANPKTAPYGKAAKEALEKAGLYESVMKKMVFAESVSQTVSYILNAADIGIVAKSSLFSPKMREFKEGRNWKSVKASLYTPIDQGVVLLKNGSEKEEAAVFFTFIFSKKAEEIFKRYGYKIP